MKLWRRMLGVVLSDHHLDDIEEELPIWVGFGLLILSYLLIFVFVVLAVWEV